MGIPLQQKWDWFESGDRAPDYYLRSDAALYYYPFVDAMVAEAVLALPPDQRERFDPMITGFNPTDMYATDHIRRVLRLYPGVFSGIGEFSIHKEVVSPKTVGHVASLRNPALDRVLEFAGEVGLLALVHNDVDVILPHEGSPPDAFRPVHRGGPAPSRNNDPLGARRHRALRGADARLRGPARGNPARRRAEPPLLRPVLGRGGRTDRGASGDGLPRVGGAGERRGRSASCIGSDSVVATDADAYLGALEAWRPLLDGLDPDASEKVRLGNYERLFDSARERVRAWEASQR